MEIDPLVNPLKAELTELLQEMQKKRGQVSLRMLQARLQMFMAKVEAEDCVVSSDIFDALDNGGRRMCLVALMTICAATLQDA